MIKLINRLKTEIRYQERLPGTKDFDYKSWHKREGILLSVNEAKKFVDLLDKEERWSDVVEKINQGTKTGKIIQSMSKIDRNMLNEPYDI